MSKEQYKKVKYFVSWHKEREWLEQMALQGFFLEDIKNSLFYTFRKGEPKRMLYEVDCFLLPKNPTIEEIRHKELCLDLAEQFGWKEVTHSEKLVYYFAKEYVKGEGDELYNDEESRALKGERFVSVLRDKIDKLPLLNIILVLLAMVLKPELYEDGTAHGIGWYTTFVFCYVIFTSLTMLCTGKIIKIHKKEFMMSRQQWQESRSENHCKMVRRIVFTGVGLSHFLRKEAENGWFLKRMTTGRYYFEKGNNKTLLYTMDSKFLLNKRRKKRKQEEVSDKKDTLGMSNDWQVMSVKEAEEKGWTFVCAFENRAIIYSGEAFVAKELNSDKVLKWVRGVSLIGNLGVMMIVSALIGGIIGGIVGYFV
ncbi:DUF2812 domain-containing protein [Lachnospiraceae bacterium OttesenSCG-928-D06]|nr:DUF2812 domain-containing protein [Lachnospiraceae bacterium OttesenSCG-928-D06]